MKWYRTVVPLRFGANVGGEDDIYIKLQSFG
jgi:hypothetical protein